MIGQSGIGISDLAREQMIDQYGGAVESQFAKSSIMRQVAGIRTLRGTDTMVNRRVGRTTIQGVTVGVAPEPIYTPFGKVAVTVDTVIIARDSQSLLNEFQSDFDVRSELGMDHGKEMAKFFDESFLVQAIKGAQKTLTADETLKGAFQNGKQQTLAAAGDESDPDKFAKALSNLIVAFREQDIDSEELALFVRPTQFEVLLQNDKLVDRDWSGDNGNYALRKLFFFEGVRIVETARIPTAATASGSHHILSNSTNGYAYDITAQDAKCKAVLGHARSLLAAEAIPLTSDVWYDKQSLLWYIDSFTSYGVTVNRPDLCGAVFSA